TARDLGFGLRGCLLLLPLGELSGPDRVGLPQLPGFLDRLLQLRRQCLATLSPRRELARQRGGPRALLVKRLAVLRRGSSQCIACSLGLCRGCRLLALAFGQLLRSGRLR